MKRLVPTVVLPLATLLSTLAVARAQSIVYWDGDGQGSVAGGSGTWSTSNANWSATSDGSAYAVWVDGDHATFTGTGGTVTIGGGGVSSRNLTFSASGYTITGDPLTLLSGSVINTGSSPVTIESLLVGSSGFTKSTGSSTLILTANNTMTGTATISSGTLQLGNGGTSGSYAGNIMLGGPGTRLTINRSDTLTLTGNIGGTGTIDIASGTLAVGGTAGVISGATGNLTVNLANTAGATLDVLGNVAVANLSGGGTTGGNIILRSGATLTINSNAQPSTNLNFAGVISGEGGLAISSTIGITRTLTLTGANTFTGPVTISGSSSTLRIGNGVATGSLAANVTIAGGTLVFQPGVASTYSGVISGSTGNLTKVGSGTLMLTGQNTFAGTGMARVTEGILQIGDGGTTGAYAGSITTNATLAFNRSDAATHSATITGTGGITQAGSGALTLSGGNNYTGGTTIAAGTLVLGSSGAIGSSGTISFTGGTLRVSAVNTTDYSSRFSTAAGQSYKFDTDGQSVTFASALTSSGATLLKSGTGTLTLSAANTYSGDTTVTGGTLTLGHALALQNSRLILSGGTLSFGSLAAATLGGVSGDVALTNASSGAVTLSLGNGTTDASSNANLSGSGGFAKTGTSTVTLSGDSSYSGATTVTAGTLAAASNTAFGAGTLVLNGGTIQASGGSVTLPNAVSLSTSSTISGSQPLTLAGAITLHGFNPLTVTNSARTTFSGGIGESTPSILIKQGSGELELTGASSYTGGTFLQAGTIRINNSSGSAFGTGAVTVANGAVLTGAGSFTGAVQLNGTFSPGNSPGTQSTGSHTWAPGANFIWEINNATGAAGGTSGWDLLSISGSLTIAATSASKFTVNLTSLTALNAPDLVPNFNPASNYSFDFVTATGGISGFTTDAFTLDTSGFRNDFTGTWSITSSPNALALSYTASAIPEPSTYTLLAGAVALAFAGLRRRHAITRPPNPKPHRRLQP